MTFECRVTYFSYDKQEMAQMHTRLTRRTTNWFVAASTRTFFPLVLEGKTSIQEVQHLCIWFFGAMCAMVLRYSFCEGTGQCCESSKWACTCSLGNRAVLQLARRHAKRMTCACTSTAEKMTFCPSLFLMLFMFENNARVTWVSKLFDTSDDAWKRWVLRLAAHDGSGHMLTI